MHPYSPVPRLSNTTANFTVSKFDANGTSTHHVNQTPEPFGASTWARPAPPPVTERRWTGASRAPNRPTPSMVPRPRTATTTRARRAALGRAIPGLLCQLVEHPQIDGDRVHLLSYGIVNAPMTVQVVNNTGQTMTASGSATSIASQQARLAPPTPGSINQGQSAYYGLFRATGQSATFRVSYRLSTPTTRTKQRHGDGAGKLVEHRRGRRAVVAHGHLQQHLPRQPLVRSAPGRPARSAGPATRLVRQRRDDRVCRTPSGSLHQK